MRTQVLRVLKNTSSTKHAKLPTNKHAQVHSMVPCPGYVQSRGVQTMCAPTANARSTGIGEGRVIYKVARLAAFDRAYAANMVRMGDVLLVDAPPMR